MISWIILAASLLINFQNEPQENYHDVYIIKNYWHTGIVFRNSDKAANIITALKDFPDYNYLDIGWGDEVYYQHPDPAIELGARAILVPTSSVIRIAGNNASIEKIVEWSDFVIKFNLTEEEFLSLCVFIKNSFTVDSELLPIKTSEKSGGRIKFYKSNLMYHLLNTCNKWVADAFIYVGYDISSFDIITAHNLYEEIYKFGEVLKEETE